jgi:hypothetical protein
MAVPEIGTVPRPKQARFGAFGFLADSPLLRLSSVCQAGPRRMQRKKSEGSGRKRYRSAELGELASARLQYVRDLPKNREAGMHYPVDGERDRNRKVSTLLRLGSMWRVWNLSLDKRTNAQALPSAALGLAVFGQTTSI